MASSLKLLIVGGYGTFGGRLVELLEGEAGLTCIVAGRSQERAKAYCTQRKNARAVLIPAVFDRARDLKTQLSTLQPDIVVDASGPFQNYGAAPYRLIETCIAQGIHYLDLADGADFVTGVQAYNAEARAAGVFVLSGVSSFPVLTAAVVQDLSKDMAQVQSVTGGIAPSPYAGVGRNVIGAISSYAGQPIKLNHAGEEKTVHPFTACMRYTISPPGFLPLHNKLFSLVDVPDLKVLPKIWPEANNIWMGVAPVPEILHRMLMVFSWFVKKGMVKSLRPIAPIMAFIVRYLRWGEDRGGMFVEVAGQDKKGRAILKSWHLLAEGRDGPFIPSMAAEFIVREILSGKKIKHGARMALEDITLEDYNALFHRRSIETGVRDKTEQEGAPLYQNILGRAWTDLPKEISKMHDVQSESFVSGKAKITRGWNPLGHLACAILGMPKAGEDIDVTVTFTVQDKIETWTRNFAGKIFKSQQYLGTGREQGLVIERFGILRFGMALVSEENKLKLVLRRWRIFGIPLPMWLCVKSDSFETVIDGRFHFHVKLSHPLIGLIIHYQGWLEKGEGL